MTKEAEIVGYLVPDGFSGSCSLRISDGQKDLAVLLCDQELPAIAAAGRHATGRCGFIIDETIVPELAQKEALELYDQETNLRIYRRRSPSHVTHKRIFRLETHLFPLWRLDDRAEPHFQYFYKGIERHGRETAVQMFLLHNAPSVYLSGRLIYKMYDTNIDDTFNTVVLLRHPLTELAERILTLKHVRKFGEELLGARDMMTYAAAIEFAATVEPDEKVLRRAFAAISRPAIATLTNPLTRQLAARAPDEISVKGGIATALGTLSRFAIVGLRDRQDVFLQQLAELIGVPSQSLPEFAEFPSTAELAEKLKSVPEVGLLIEQDLEVYHQVKSAVENLLDGDTVASERCG